jgi:hypothetical protein
MNFKIPLTAVLSLCICLFTISAFAEDIKMTCTFQHKDFYNGKFQTKYLKYSDPIFSSKNIYRNRNGEWDNWCRSVPAHYKPCKISIAKKGAVMIGHLKDKLLKVFSGKPAGYQFIKVIKYTLDFEDPKLHINTHYETFSGKRLFEGLKDWERWVCEHQSNK